MATAEVPRADGRMDRRAFLRYAGGVTIRGAAAFALTHPFVRAVESATAKIDPAIAAAQAKFPNPNPPATSPELRAVANQENDLIAQRNAVESTQNRIPSSSLLDTPPRGDFLRRAWEDDKTARIQAINQELADFQKSPTSRNAIENHVKGQQSYVQNYAEAGRNRSNEQSRLEGEAGVTWTDRLAHIFRPQDALLGRIYAIMGAAALPFVFRKGAWPLPEAQAPTQPQSTEQI